VIENTQRDLNIALMNELSLICHRVDIDTLDVLQAAETKWNFLPFRPGLVGGHCICVDPYYLTHKAQEVRYHPEVILAGRRVNDAIVSHVADQTVKLMLRKGMPVPGGKVLVLGLTFKENCPDIRNTKVVDLVRLLQGYCLEVEVYDPWIDVEAARREYGLTFWMGLRKTAGTTPSSSLWVISSSSTSAPQRCTHSGSRVPWFSMSRACCPGTCRTHVCRRFRWSRPGSRRRILTAGSTPFRRQIQSW